MEADLMRDMENAGVSPKEVISEAEDKFLPELPGGPWDHKSANRAQVDRYLMAVLGGVILIGPMILMVLVGTVLTRLLTVSLCTLAFAFALAIRSNRLPLELLSATAAYTAILVVFVGTAT
jgi:hypothetical protein